MVRRQLLFLPYGICAQAPGSGTVLIVTEETYGVMLEWLIAVLKRGEKCYLDFLHHDDGEAAFFIDRFTSVEGSGIYCRGEWSKVGAALASAGKITGVSCSLPVRGMTVERAREWIPDVEEVSAEVPEQVFRLRNTSPPVESINRPVVCEVFLPLHPWPAVGGVAIAPMEPALKGCRINALVGARKLSGDGSQHSAVSETLPTRAGAGEMRVGMVNSLCHAHSAGIFSL